MRKARSRLLRCVIRQAAALLVALTSISAPTASAQNANAYDAWSRLFDTIRPNWNDPSPEAAPDFFTQEEYDAIDEWREGPLEPPQGAARSYFEKAESIAPLIRDLRGTPHFDAELDFSQGFMLLLPHLSSMREVCRISSHLARRATATGDQNAAVEWLGTLNEISSHAGQDGTAIGSLVGAAMYMKSDQTMELAIANGLIDAESAATILESMSMLREEADPFHFGNSIAGERLLLNQSLDALLGDRSTPPTEEMLDVYRSAFGDGVIEKTLGLSDGGDGIRNTMNNLFDRMQIAFDDPDRERGIETLAEIETELEAPDMPELVRKLFPSLTQLAMARLRVERILNDRVRGLDAVASGRVSPDEIRNGAILWLQIGRGMLEIPTDAQRAGLRVIGTEVIEPGSAVPDSEIWAAAYRPIASRWLMLGLDASAIAEADFDITSGLRPQSDSSRALGTLRAAARGYLADAADRLQRAMTMPEDDDSTPENERYVAANEIAVTIALAGHLIRDPGVARVRLAAAIIEDTAALLATNEAQAMREDPILRMQIADAAAKLPRLDGLDASTATMRDAKRFTHAELRALAGDAAESAATSLATIPPGRLYSIFAAAEGRSVVSLGTTRPARQTVPEPFADVDDLFPYRPVELADSPLDRAGIRKVIRGALAQVQERPEDADRLLGRLDFGRPLPIRRAADAAMVRITEIDEFCRAPGPVSPAGDP
jgi:hypothetical protein